ncbi:MAG: DUF4738 domain-containing protein [Bacteroidaceae bacterium]|nr:DUF4738 domain-containing protein [Bacteroidaceae bacterium]
MTRTHAIVIGLATALIMGCKGTPKQPTPQREVETVDSVTGIINLRELHITDSVQVNGQTFAYHYDFTHNDSMPVVRNPQGDDYHDNQVTLSIVQGNRTVLQRTFTKHDFKALVPSEFMNSSALVGFTYDYTKQDDHTALYFIATVGDPDETADMSYPIQLKITPAGTVSFDKATDLDTEPIHPGLTIDPSDEGGV